MPVVETVAVRTGGERELIEAIDRHPVMRTARPHRLPAPHSVADVEATQREVRRILDAIGYRVPARLALLARLDAVVLHPVAGPLLLAARAVPDVPGGVQLGDRADGLIKDGVGGARRLARPRRCSDGPLRSLLVDGVIAGVGGVLVFLPQILILFFFILVLEDSGYLPRAAFLLDRLMGKVGLSGRAFIPLLSSFACAIPGHHGHAHHSVAARPPRHDHDRAADDLLGAPAGVCAADRARSFRRDARRASSTCRAWCCSRCTSPAWSRRWRWPSC